MSYRLDALPKERTIQVRTPDSIHVEHWPGIISASMRVHFLNGGCLYSMEDIVRMARKETAAPRYIEAAIEDFPDKGMCEQWLIQLETFAVSRKR